MQVTVASKEQSFKMMPCWSGRYGRWRSPLAWKATPLSLKLSVWTEQNNSVLKGLHKLIGNKNVTFIDYISHFPSLLYLV